MFFYLFTDITLEIMMFKDLVFLFINSFLNKIPSRGVRMLFYNILSKGKISRKASIGLGVRILDIRKVQIGDFSNINFRSMIDGRGDGVAIGSRVDIAPEVNIWSLEHETKTTEHKSVSSKVFIEDDVWIGNRAIILPGAVCKRGTIVGAGSVYKKRSCEGDIFVGNPTKKIRERDMVSNLELNKIRRFR
jgi:acetyltransferase-like isoleucine patch superfamily enzyme